MDLLKNPFYILTATPRDSRSRIMELADERSLMLDSNECMNARSDLTNPRKRLSSEVAWLLGLSPQHSDELLSLLQESPKDILSIVQLSSIARVNLLAAGILRLPIFSPEQIAGWIIEISWEFECIDAEELKNIINDERAVSGFPEVKDLSMLEKEIQERRSYYRSVFKSVLNNLPATELVKTVTIVVESATTNEDESEPILIADLVDAYEVEAQDFLEKEERNIKILIEKLRAAADEKYPDLVLISMINQLISVVRNWDVIAQPIQLSAKNRGVEHEPSERVATLVRDLAIYVFNEHDKLDYSLQLINMLQDVFAEVEKVAERTAEDADMLRKISRKMKNEKDELEKWQRGLTYEADIGLIFKDKLRISSEGIEWRGSHWPLDTITCIRWSGTRHSVNGVSTGSTYKVRFGKERDSISIELKNESVYINFIDRLWKFVGVRLFAEYLQGLKDGKVYQFGSTILADHGMELERKFFFSSNERIFCRWSELIIWNSPGALSIGKKSDKKVSETFSYENADNIHILEALVSMILKKGGNKLSSLLGKEN